MFLANSPVALLTARIVIMLGLIVTCNRGGLPMAKSLAGDPEAQAASRSTGCSSKPVIVQPKEGASLGPTEIVTGTTTCSGWRHYVLVTPPNGVDWVQDKECAYPSRNAFSCASVKFGEGRIGIGQRFTIRIAVVKGTLVPGPLEESPAELVLSMPITVMRVR